jgi:hypothetical protein
MTGGTADATAAWRTVCAPTGLDWRRLGAERLLALLGRRLPYNLRYTVDGEALAVVGAVPLQGDVPSRRAPWLAAAVRAAAAGAEAPLAPPQATRPGREEELLDMVRWLTAGMGWRWLEHDGAALRFAVPGEPDLPPLAIVPRADHLHVERPLPLLPARDAAAAVRAAVAHGVLVLHGSVQARVAVRDPAALTLAVETSLPAADLEEDEVACVLEGVRRAAARATAVLDCLRHPAVARVYATAHSLPAPAAAREHVMEE